MVNDHSDRCCPLRIGLVDPFQMAIHCLYMGDPNYLPPQKTNMTMEKIAMNEDVSPIEHG